MKYLLYTGVLIFSIEAFSDSWPGEAGKICFDTPKPRKFSGQDHKQAFEPGSPFQNGTPQENLKKLETRETRYEGELQLVVDAQLPIDLPKNRGVMIEGLDPSAKHKLKIKNKSGHVWEVFSFKFEDPRDPRISVGQGGFYHIGMQINPPPKRCRWAKNADSSQ